MSTGQTAMVRVGLDLRLAGYRGGGISRYARDLYQSLSTFDGTDITPLRSARDRDADPGAIRLRTPPHHRFERRALALELRLRGRRLMAYHTPDFIVPTGLHVPAIATVQDLAFLRWPDDLTPDGLRYYRQLEQSVRDTAAWITPSEWTAHDLSTAYGIPIESIHVIPLGIPLDHRADPLPRESRRGYILAVGTIEPRKRYDLLLDALDDVDERVHLIAVGHPGWNTDSVQARLRSHPRVTWLQGVDDARLGQLYAEAIALVFPSRAEGFGLPAVEAMAAGTPIVSSGGGALREVTLDAALTVEEWTPEAWAAAIERILDDDALWSCLATGGHARALAFSWAETARRTLDVYRDVVVSAG